MHQSHHTPGPRTGCSRTVHGLFWIKIVRPLKGPVRDPCGAGRLLPPSAGSVEFLCMHYKLTDLHRFRDRKQPANNPHGERKGPCGPVPPQTTPVRDFCKLLCQFPYVYFILGCRTAPSRVPHGPREGPVGYEKYNRFPCRARTTSARVSHGVNVWNPANYSIKP